MQNAAYNLNDNVKNWINRAVDGTQEHGSHKALPLPRTGKWEPVDGGTILAGGVSAHCHGYAFHGNKEIGLLNIGGPRTAVEAIRAHVTMGSTSLKIMKRYNSEGIRPSSFGYTVQISAVNESRYVNILMVDNRAFYPDYLGTTADRVALMFSHGAFAEDMQAARTYDHVFNLVGISIFPEWAMFLFKAGVAAGLIRKGTSTGGVILHILELDSNKWEYLITRGLATGAIRFPEKEQ